jgi:flagellar motor switch protein FliN/FliY
MASNDPPSGAAPESTAAAARHGEQEAPFASLEPQAGSMGVGTEFEEAAEAQATGAPLDLVLDIPVRLSVELGRTEIPIRDVVTLGRGSMIELDGSPGAPLDVRVNGVLIGRGEVVVINEERLGLRFIEVASQSERIKRLR